MTAFEHLEQELCRGVRRAYSPARRSWRRPTLLSLVAGLVVGASALAATGTIRIGHTHADPGGLKPQPGVFAGVRAGAARTLSLRVRDPAGGPPWTLRVFDSSRGGHCVQVGQVVRDHFGVFEAGVLEPTHAWPGGGSSICGGQARAGFPIVRGLQSIRTIGGSGDFHRCRRLPHGDCPLTSVTVLRYGLLGPGARSVRLVDARGATVATSVTNPGLGGAYLFAVGLPTAPYAAADRARRAAENALERHLRAAVAHGETLRRALPEAFAGESNLRARLRLLQPDFRVVATFANGQTLQVAGRKRSTAPLPGVARSGAPQPAPPPGAVTVAVHIVHPGRFATIALAFRAPLAITRFDVHYSATLHGHTGTRCDRSTGGGGAYTTRDIANGETVRFVLRRPHGFYEDGREGWCPGHFTGEVRYATPSRNTTIGHYAFSIP